MSGSCLRGMSQYGRAFFLDPKPFCQLAGYSIRHCSLSNSVNIGLFGLLWMVSVGFVVAMVGRLTREREA